MLLFYKTLPGTDLIGESSPLRITVGVLLVALISAIGYFDRSNWDLMVSLYAAAFLIFTIVCIAKPRENAFMFWIGVAFVARVILIFMFPNLSDDVYRFIWDGQLTINGINPYLTTPSEIMSTGAPWSSASELYSNMNSPDYFTVYPPPSQVLFAISAWAGQGSIYWSSVVLKLFLVAADILTVMLMYRILKPKSKEYRVLFFALNPLVILEFAGNCHTESLMICALVASYAVLLKSDRMKGLGRSAVLYALSVGFKLLPVLAIPSLIRRFNPGKFVVWSVVVTAVGAVILAPMWLTMPGRSATSLALYFETFEFNASLYYVLRWIGYMVKGYNMIDFIGPALAAAGIVGILIYSALDLQRSIKTWPNSAMFVFAIYFFCAPIVHPWYVTIMLALSVFTPYRFPFVWSGMVFLSYSAYRLDTYSENLWLVGLEYGVVFAILIYELIIISGTRRFLLTE